MGATEIEYCEHGEIKVACLECMAMPQKMAPQPKPRQKATKSPSSGQDLIAPLGGSLDMSLPVESVGPLVGSEWLSAHAFPHDLRRSGWLYLRCEGSLGARVKAKKVEWRDERPVPGADDQGSGMVIIVDPTTWDDSVDIPLGELAGRQIKGYRYLKAGDEGEVVHYSGGKPVVFADPDDDLDDD